MLPQLSSKNRGHNTPLGHHTDHGPMGLGQYNSLGEYYDPHTASSVFLILIFTLLEIQIECSVTGEQRTK